MAGDRGASSLTTSCGGVTAVLRPIWSRVLALKKMGKDDEVGRSVGGGRRGLRGSLRRWDAGQVINIPSEARASWAPTAAAVGGEAGSGGSRRGASGGNWALTGRRPN